MITRIHRQKLLKTAWSAVLSLDWQRPCIHIHVTTVQAPMWDETEVPWRQSTHKTLSWLTGRQFSEQFPPTDKLRLTKTCSVLQTQEKGDCSGAPIVRLVSLWEGCYDLSCKNQLVREQFLVSLEFYFHVAFTDGKEVTFWYQLMADVSVRWFPSITSCALVQI
jgi:hypothetical protein